ncbi:DUF1311 domain-containing protein [Zymobacter palmae]|uniref:DUF1311 domain-containing protein n=1 Tax=Zymobacter palmae TaxID=33074 RepID=UPI000482B88D|nr:DUF1311 domain-containing protein [Zymobacter palmae]
MALRTSKILFLLSFIPLSICHAKEINSCYDEPYAYKVTECFNEKIESQKEEYGKIRSKYITEVSKMTDDYKIFVKKEKMVNTKWLKLIEEDCKMRAMSAGEEDGEAYGTAYLACTYDRYVERTKSYKNFFITN